MRIVRLKPYLRAMKRMGIGEADMRRIERDLVAAPLAHPVIKGLKGVRKARFAFGGRGKRGGGRLIYFVAIGEALYCMTAYAKNERDDLTNEQRKVILAIIDAMTGDGS